MNVIRTSDEKVFKDGDRIIWTARGGAQFNGRSNGMSRTGKRVEIEVWIPDRPPLRSGHTHRTWVKPESVELQS
jgi:hypothetical protein